MPNDTVILGKGILLKKPIKLTKHLFVLDAFEDYILHTEEFTVLWAEQTEQKIWFYPEDAGDQTSILKLNPLDKKEEYITPFETAFFKELKEVDKGSALLGLRDDYPEKHNIETLVNQFRTTLERLIKELRRRHLR